MSKNAPKAKSDWANGSGTAVRVRAAVREPADHGPESPDRYKRADRASGALVLRERGERHLDHPDRDRRDRARDHERADPGCAEYSGAPALDTLGRPPGTRGRRSRESDRRAAVDAGTETHAGERRPGRRQSGGDQRADDEDDSSATESNA